MGPGAAGQAGHPQPYCDTPNARTRSGHNPRGNLGLGSSALNASPGPAGGGTAALRVGTQSPPAPSRRQQADIIKIKLLFIR